MAEQASPRVALVFGDAAQVAHVREALAGQAEIVAETGGAADFDLARLAAVHTQAVLVNLDGADWLGDAAARLDEAGVRTVFNDPEISHKLEGWDQARWRRHLVAKLRGSTDFDPPRPAFGVVMPVEDKATVAPVANESATPEASPPAAPVSEASVPAVAADAAVAAAAPDAESAPEPAPAFVPVTVQPDALERPLSMAEIESMSADFVAAEPAAPAASGHAAVSAPAATELADAVSAPEMMAPATESAAPVEVTAEPAVAAVAADRITAEPATEPELDVDTAALSAMIDARLAEVEPAAEAPAEVWRVAEDNPAASVESPPADAAAEPASPVVAQAAAPAPSAAPTVAPVEDADVLQGMPALGDWQLVDPNEPIAPATKPPRESPQTPATGLDFAGLELVPMESITPIELHTDPIERWMEVKARDKAEIPAKGAAPHAAPERPDGDRA